MAVKCDGCWDLVGRLHNAKTAMAYARTQIRRAIFTAGPDLVAMCDICGIAWSDDPDDHQSEMCAALMHVWGSLQDAICKANIPATPPATEPQTIGDFVSHRYAEIASAEDGPPDQLRDLVVKRAVDAMIDERRPSGPDWGGTAIETLVRTCAEDAGAKVYEMTDDIGLPYTLPAGVRIDGRMVEVTVNLSGPIDLLDTTKFVFGEAGWFERTCIVRHDRFILTFTRRTTP